MRLLRASLLTPLLLPAVALLAAAPPRTPADLDSRIQDAARTSYAFKTYLKDDDIKVDSNDGAVVLTGTVALAWHKTLAGETVANLPGVKSVDNRLAISSDEPPEHSDGWVTAKVKANLLFHWNVSATSTGVSTEGGVVTLTGVADSEAEKELATEYARDVEGVTGVRNEMTVAMPAKSDKPAARSFDDQVDDASITAQVKTALILHKSTHAMATQVSTRSGVVTLRGEAQNRAEKDLVGKLVDHIKGVKRVDNRMTVRKS